MKKILIIHPNLSNGGAEKMIMFVSNALVDEFDIQLCILEEANISLEVNEKIKLQLLKGEKAVAIHEQKFLSKILYFLNYLKILKQSISASNSDYILCFDDRVSLGVVLLTLFSRKKIILSQRADPFSKSRFWKIITYLMYWKCDKIVFQTENAALFYPKHILKKSMIIFNPAIMRNGLEINPDMLKREDVIVSAGRLQYRKGFDILISAFNLLINDYPNLKLEIYGEGSEKENLKELINKYKLQDNVFLKGVVDDVMGYCMGSKMFVFTSRSEGIPNVLIEAIMSDIPCIATDCSPGGAALLLENGRNGILVENEDVQGVYKAMKEYIKNPEKADDYARKAKESMNRFDKSKIENEWVHLFKLI